MTPFNFPPPPPPPPKATSTESHEPYASQRGKPNNPRAGRGRGWQGRGRGNRERGSSGGANQHAHYSAAARGGGQQQNRRFAHTQLQPQAPSVSSSSTLQPHPDGDSAYVPRNYPANTPPIPSPQANNKRKRGDHTPYQKLPHGSTAGQTSPQNTRPQRVKVASAPAIPSFGFSLPSLTPAAPLAVDTKKRGDKKRKVQLGLSGKEVEMEDKQNLVEEEEKEEEEFDEEAELASTMGVQGMAFEHNGVQISLQTQAEISAWIKDRRKEYPTRQRVAEKEREAAERRAKELEFLHRVQGKKRAKKQPDELSIASTVESARPHAVPETKVSSLNGLRGKAKESSLGKARPPDSAKMTTVDLGLGYASDSASESGYSILDQESSVVSSSSEESDEGSDGEDSDSGPETQSSKVEVPPIVLPTPAPPLVASPAPASPQLAPDAEKKDERRLCSSWKNNGSCRYGKHCRYAHPPKETEKRKGLYERWIEQEKDKADRLALDTIKWLGRNGFLG